MSSVARSGGLGTQDLHAHTTFSDGALPLKRVVELAAERGVAIGISDHVSKRNYQHFVATDAALARYLGALDAAPVFRAAEFCWCDSFWAEIPDDLMRRFDYRIGSNHGFPLPDGTMASPWWQQLPEPWSGQPERLMDLLVEALCQMVGTMPIEIAAHSTLLPPALLALEGDVLAWWTEAREERYVSALKKSGVALEISNRYRLPHSRLLERAKAAGARFSLGSDGHSEAQLARLDWAVEAARAAGITEQDLFVAERKTARAR